MLANVPVQILKRTLGLVGTRQVETALAAGHIVTGPQFQIAVVGCRGIFVELELRRDLGEKQENVRTVGRLLLSPGQQGGGLHRPLLFKQCLSQRVQAIGIFRLHFEGGLEHAHRALRVPRSERG